jgi:hypothetical protein
MRLIILDRHQAYMTFFVSDNAILERCHESCFSDMVVWDPKHLKARKIL